MLSALLQRPGDLILRDEIMAAAWRGVVVEDNNLTIQIASLRRVLDRDGANGSCIQTVPRARLPLCGTGDAGRACQLAGVRAKLR